MADKKKGCPMNKVRNNGCRISCYGSLRVSFSTHGKRFIFRIGSLIFCLFQQPSSHMGRMSILTPFLPKEIQPTPPPRINHIIEFQHPPNLSISHPAFSPPYTSKAPESVLDNSKSEEEPLLPKSCSLSWWLVSRTVVNPR